MQLRAYGRPGPPIAGLAELSELFLAIVSATCRGSPTSALSTKEALFINDANTPETFRSFHVPWVEFELFSANRAYRASIHLFSCLPVRFCFCQTVPFLLKFFLPSELFLVLCFYEFWSHGYCYK